MSNGAGGTQDLIRQAKEAEDWPRYPAKKTAELIHKLRKVVERQEREIHYLSDGDS